MTEGSAAAGAPTVCFTVDYEPDCPPYLSSTYRGVEQATAPLLAMLAELGVAATWFSTGDVAERYPDAVRAIVGAGHELGCHGHTHRRFDAMGPADARDEVDASTRVLRAFAPVDAFRAPNLAFPDAYLPLLERAGYRLDSSHAKYKRAYWRDRRRPAPTRLARIPASVTSSVLRLPRPCARPTSARSPARSCCSCTRGSSSTSRASGCGSTAASTPARWRSPACAPCSRRIAAAARGS
jgi:peptidoglycan/xylan/chitin deacetylase (PgdA/CDA1 family)